MVERPATPYWLEEAGRVEPWAPAERDLTADVLIVGGGYTGMWTALRIKAAEPGTDVALLEAGICGQGPSGRNGGIVNPLWGQLATLEARFGARAALAVGEASAESVRALGRWCEEEGADAWYEPHPLLEVSSAPNQDGSWVESTDACRRLGAEASYRTLSAEDVRAMCDSPAFRAGAVMAPGATVQPARLARALRAALRDRGVSAFERSPVARLRRDGGGVIAEAGAATVRAHRAVVAVNAALAGWPGFGRRLSVTSSHMVVTEPVPDVLAAHGWAGGPPVTDHKPFLHYLRPTRDNRIAIGWGGGPMGFGGRLNGSLVAHPASSDEAIAGLLAFFPGLRGRAITHSWGGPIDVSPVHLPIVETHGPVAFAHGYTGNGVGPSHLLGGILADVALDRRTSATRLALVDPPGLPRFPPEPFRHVGGALVRRALIRRDRAESGGRRADWPTRQVAELPRRLGMNLPR